MIEITYLKKKQLALLRHLKIAGEKLFKLKIHDDLSPIGWHIIHCLYVECIWIRSQFLDDSELANKLKDIADGINIKPKNRGINLPNYEYLYKLTKNEFNRNLIFMKNIKEKKKVNYFIQFLINHHSQHLESIKIILNLINFKYNKVTEKCFSIVEPKLFKFYPINIKAGIFKIGSQNKKNFSYDNEKPLNSIRLESFQINKKPIHINEWLGFIKEGGYKNKKFWSKPGWEWKYKNKISLPLGWVFHKNNLSISTPYGFKKAKINSPVSNISYYELEAFAKWVNLNIPHELQWEASHNKIINKFNVWEWCYNKFFPYEGFKPYPYKEYSVPWFNNYYHTLKGASIFSEKELKRKTFRNFHKANVRYIFSGGRLSKS